MRLKHSIQAVILFITFLFAQVSLGEVNINTATPEELAMELKGVGKKKADRIVTYREQHGPFESVMDLALVKGIGPKTIENNLDNIVVEVNTALQQ